MGFWSLEGQPESAIACTDGFGFSMTYGQLNQAVQEVTARLQEFGTRELGFIHCTNSPEWLVAYLAALNANHVPLLLPDDTADALAAPLLDIYGPRWSWRNRRADEARADSTRVTADALEAFESCARPRRPQLAAALGCLLSTSGSTGSPKLVRLSYDALDANARSIATYLNIGPEDRALTTLPTSYSYGLSVVNSHLAGGGTLVCRTVSPLTRDFLETVNREKVTSLAGVPSWYQMLLRAGFDKAETPSVRTMTQAGGRLDDRLKKAVLEMAQRKGIRFFVMYGQTEATARISYVPPEALPDHLDSIGIPIPGGRITLDPTTSEIIYHGTNVMMGYAERAEDLMKPDECHAQLRTGDIGAVDPSGFFRVTGRIKRFIKLSGNRVSLDELETALARLLPTTVAVTGRDERLGVFIENMDPALADEVRAFLTSAYGLHHSLFRIEQVADLPLLPTGKKDYGKLIERLG